jgi:hypothetical protein
MEATKKSTKTAVRTAKPAPKKERKPSPYGVTVEIMCTNPDMEKAELIKKLKARKIDVEAGASAITTGIAQTKKVVKLLRQNGHLK